MTGVRFRWSLVFLTVLIAASGSQRTSAFKLETHVWIAEQVLNDIAACRAANSGRACVNIEFTDPTTHSVVERRAYFLDPPLASSLDHYPEAYRMGALGPDAFPDIAGGQMTTHPGVKGYMLADEWLKWVLEGAGLPRFHFVGGTPTGGGKVSKAIVWDGSEQHAFALGYIAHAAGDIFAHSFVNTYAGDVFWLNDSEQEVEFRHMSIEGMIRDYMPSFANGTAVDNAFMPDDTAEQRLARKNVLEFIANRLILNPTVAHQYGLPDVTMPHLWAMHEVWDRQNQLIEKIKSGREALDRKIKETQDRIDTLKEFTITLGGCVSFLGHNICTPTVSYTLYPYFCWLDGFVTCSTITALEGALSVVKAGSDQSADDFSGEIADWHRDTGDAVTAYVETSEAIAREIMKGETGHPLTAYNDWINCYVPVFTRMDPLSRAITCPTIGLPLKAVNFAKDLCAKVAQFSTVLAWGTCPMFEVQEFVAHALLDSGFVTGIVAAMPGVDKDSGVTQMVRFRTQNGDTETDEGRLTDEFSSSTSAKHLLNVPDIVCRLRAEMHITEGNCQSLVRSAFDPARFHPVYNAIQLTKLTLLGAGELNRMVHDQQIGDTVYGPDMYQATTPFNVLFNAVRSIDGNQQWQERPIRYPRSNTNAGGAPSDIAVTDETTPFGRPYSIDGGPDGGPTGFRLWQDCEARSAIFKRVFTGPLAQAIEDPTTLGLAEILADGDPNRAGRLDPFPLAQGSVLPTKFEIDGGTIHFLCRPDDGLTAPDRRHTAPVVLPDTTPPTLTPPPDVVAECHANGASLVELGSPTVSDNRDSSPDVTNDAPEVFPYGDTTVNWHAEDATGNGTDRSQTVHVVDRLRPVFAPLAPISIIATSPNGMPVSVAPPVAVDSCDGAIVATRMPGPGLFSLGQHTIVWRAQDRAGNVSVAQQLVTVSARRGDLDLDGDVDNDDVNIVLATRNTVPAPDLSLRDYDNNGVIDDNDRAVYALLQQGNGDPRDLNHDGIIDVLDARIIVTLCSRPRCAVQ